MIPVAGTQARQPIRPIPGAAAAASTPEAPAIAQEGRGNQELTAVVRGLPFSTEEAVLRNDFEQCGKIFTLRLTENEEGQVIAVIEYETQEGFEAAIRLDNTEYGGHPINVAKAPAASAGLFFPTTQDPVAPPAARPTATAEVRGLPAPSAHPPSRMTRYQEVPLRRTALYDPHGATGHGNSQAGRDARAVRQREEELRRPEAAASPSSGSRELLMTPPPSKMARRSPIPQALGARGEDEPRLDDRRGADRRGDRDDRRGEEDRPRREPFRDDDRGDREAGARHPRENSSERQQQIMCTQCSEGSPLGSKFCRMCAAALHADAGEDEALPTALPLQVDEDQVPVPIPARSNSFLIPPILIEPDRCGEHADALGFSMERWRERELRRPVYGRVEFIWSRGESYVGNFSTADLWGHCGNGKFSWEDGSTYAGDWVLQPGRRAMWMHGQGRYTWPLQLGSYDGMYDRGVKVGHGRMEWENGCWYDGPWKDNVPHSYLLDDGEVQYGTCMAVDKNIWKAIWSMGEYECEECLPAEEEEEVSAILTEPDHGDEGGGSLVSKQMASMCQRLAKELEEERAQSTETLNAAMLRATKDWAAQVEAAGRKAYRSSERIPRARPDPPTGTVVIEEVNADRLRSDYRGLAWINAAAGVSIQMEQTTDMYGWSVAYIYGTLEGADKAKQLLQQMIAEYQVV